MTSQEAFNKEQFTAKTYRLYIEFRYVDTLVNQKFSL
jgi:hypothetical protein